MTEEQIDAIQSVRTLWLDVAIAREKAGLETIEHRLSTLKDQQLVADLRADLLKRKQI